MNSRMGRILSIITHEHLSVNIQTKLASPSPEGALGDPEVKYMWFDVYSVFGAFPWSRWQNGRPSKNAAIEFLGSRWEGEIQVGGGSLRCKGIWGEIRGKTSQLTSIFPHGFQPLIPTCVFKESIGLECQNMIMEKDFDFHCCRLKEFHI